MGNLEHAAKQNKRRRNLQKLILSSVAAAGLLAVAVVAPNIIKLFGNAVDLSTTSIHRARRKLIEAGLIVKNDKGFLQVTEKGRLKLTLLEQADYKIKRPNRWDKQWRILIFDISEKRKPLREKVRRTLRSIGFLRLQDSVWVYPYPCEDLIVLLKADFKIGKDLLYIVADTIENDRILKENFGLI